QGRFVLAVGNPFGGRQSPDPLLTMGILSKRHPDDVAAAWRGQWQTDAPGLDTNAGGAVVDLEGRLVGLLNLWHPAKHGRNSGIAFVVPWERIQAVLPALREGRGPVPGFLGVHFAPGLIPRVDEVVEGTGAEAAGIRPGDVIKRIDREPVATIGEVVAVIRFRYSGEQVMVAVERDGTQLVLPATLVPR
ncbi:MAG: S1C family serine protease, partial [Planctomycetota bacterium]